ncbi:signal peptidase II [Arthrobacter castelli]|uniref:signal peptidase II n=1 Tax=Arthrobacter castelli TaxID=271431 RepID=UPI001FE19BB1|nr:signal peptidase II [Arthrobacter castelli]
MASAAVLAVLDLLVKAAAVAQLAGGEAIDMGFISVSLHCNTGVAFSMGASLPDWVIVVVTGLITVLVGSHILAAAPRLPWIARVGGVMVMAGALGNLIDRIEGRGVVDYLHTGWFPTFNLADVFITTGAVIFAIGTLAAGREDHSPQLPDRAVRK